MERARAMSIIVPSSLVLLGKLSWFATDALATGLALFLVSLASIQALLLRRQDGEEPEPFIEAPEDGKGRGDA